MDHKKCRITKEELLLILEKLHEGLSIEGKDGTILFMNESAERIFGVQYEDVENMSGKDLEANGIFNPVMSIKAAEKREKVTEFQRNRLGEEYFVTSIPIMDQEGNILFTVGYSAWDVSDTRELQEMLRRLQKENSRMKQEVMFFRGKQSSEDTLIAEDKSTKEALERIRKASAQDISVFIWGEAGTGKVFMANQYHKRGKRKESPFMALDLKYLEADPDEEIYGSREKAGILEICDKGVLVLNHIELLSKSGQEKLYRVISGEEFMAGDGMMKRSDVKIAALSENSPEELLDRGQIIPELYYLLTVVSVKLNPIYERPEDLQAYIQYFLDKYNKKYSKNITISDKAMTVLRGHKWEQNINGIKLLLERLVVMADRDIIGLYDLPASVREPLGKGMEEGIDLKDAIEFYEGEIIKRAYEKYKTTVRVARELKISQASAARKIQKYVFQKG